MEKILSRISVPELYLVRQNKISTLERNAMLVIIIIYYEIVKLKLNL